MIPQISNKSSNFMNRRIVMQLIILNLFLALQVIKYFRLFQILKNTFQLNLRIKIKIPLIRWNPAISMKRKYQEQVEKRILYIYIYITKNTFDQSRLHSIPSWKQLVTHESFFNLRSWPELHKKSLSELVLLLRTTLTSLNNFVPKYI